MNQALSQRSLRRELMLEEMGLAPRWIRRSEISRVASEPAAVGSQAAPAAAIPAPARPAAVVAPAKPAIAIRPSAAPVAPATAADTERVQSISQMDWPTLEAAVKSCTACGLCKSRSQTVFAAGNPAAELMVVGEAPGADEDRLGEPFVGQAGKLLDAMLASVGHRRSENVYIANALKCRPPQNRNPQPDEMALCTPYLYRQISLVAPKVLFAVGKFAIQALLQNDDLIKNLRGRLHDYHGTPVVISYHPAYLLRNVTDKAKAWEDLLLVQRTLKGP